MLTRQLFKSENDTKQYLKDGFVKKTLLTTEQSNSILNQLLLLKPDDNYAPNRSGSSNYHCTFLDTNESYKRATNQLFKSFFNPLVEELFNDYHVWNANFYVKPPGAGKFEIHQNWTHVVEEKFTSFTIWCPLVDTSTENGTITLVKGSHKIVPDIATLDVPYYFHNFEQTLLDNYLEPISCKAGECVIFEDGVIHFSDLNKSENPRYALQILIGPKYTQPVYYYFNKEEPEKGFEVFEINEEFFMKSNYLTFKNRPAFQKSLGFVPNTNKLLTPDEFSKALANGEKRREELYGKIY
ncbi:MAG: phytanoyl-CoA dioxygenase family protein [Bacteroidia bacterium]|nr:phytanoyl-CoA dioxygenase family protein [Bacteroidia bacterium]MCF8427063.1 phytanoyl-CoA dioxygenase family protein [Bacteroidia bacterium]MCF8446453.1 phytanoyl-CoA dioxygenase family protein [Bacteroidia bacterium]